MLTDFASEVGTSFEPQTNNAAFYTFDDAETSIGVREAVVRLSVRRSHPTEANHAFASSSPCFHVSSIFERSVKSILSASTDSLGWM